MLAKTLFFLTRSTLAATVQEDIFPLLPSQFRSIFALLPGNKLPIANSHRLAVMTSFSHAVLLEGVTIKLIRLRGVTRARGVLAYNRLLCQTFPDIVRFILDNYG